MVKLAHFFTRAGSEIADALNKKEYDNHARPYLGYSSSGSPCKRKTWYSFHWVKNCKISARTHRIFETGCRLEDVIIDDLIITGFKVYDRQRAVYDKTFHIQGHIDGIVLINDEEFLLEIKTANEKSFNSIVKYGLKLSKMDYYMQMQAYMGHLNLLKGLFLVYNKNDSSYYTEIIDFNPGIYADNERAFFSILTAEVPLDKISTDPDDFECQWCDFREICHYNEPVNQNCRTCKYVSIELEGNWKCNYPKATLYNNNLTVKEQKSGCIKYKISDMFLPL